MSLSPAQRFQAMPAAQREAVLAALSPASAAALLHTWRGWWARPEQLLPGTPGAAEARTDWRVWLILAGRGWGKSRTGAQAVIEHAREHPEEPITLAGPTIADVRDDMISPDSKPGQSGIIASSPPDFLPHYNANQRRIYWPNGAVAQIVTAEEPESPRGKQHAFLWADEVCRWQYPDEAWSMLMFGLRIGRNPRAVVTTTPKPIPWLTGNRERGGSVLGMLHDPHVIRTTGTSYDNVQNLAPAFRELLASYEGTHLGEQEIKAAILGDVPGALWTRDLIEQGAAALGRGQRGGGRVTRPPQLRRIVVAVDPAMTSKPTSDETGIVWGGIGPCMCRGVEEQHAFVLGDASGVLTPGDWGRRVLAAYVDHRADRIVAEVNNGGDLVEQNVRIAEIERPGEGGMQRMNGGRAAYKAIHASKGKHTRAEPIAALYEKGQVHHVGLLGQLESEMCTWVPSSGAASPNRMDALVWLLTELLLETGSSYLDSLRALKPGDLTAALRRF